MSVLEVKEDWQGLEADISAEGAAAVRAFIVTFDTSDNPEDRPVIAYDASGVPALYATHPKKFWLYVKEKRVENVGPFIFRVLVYYDAKSYRGGEEPEDPTENPLTRAPRISWGFSTSNEPIDRDIANEPLTNSSGESFDPPITRDVDDLVLRIQRNEDAFDPVVAADYKGALNSDWFYGFAPGLVRCINFSADSARQGSLFYWQVTYEFQMRRDGWKRKILDEGFREATGTDDDGKPTYEQITDDTDKPVSQPVLLDGSGEKKAEADPAVYLEFDLYVSKPFAVLGL